MKNFYKRVMNKLRPLVLMLAILVSIIPETSYAASVSISVSGGTIEQGETTSVTISISSSAVIGAYRFSLNYDSSIVEYVPGAGDDSFCNGGAGTLIFVNDPYSKSASHTIKFKGVAPGSSNLSVSYDAGDILDESYNDMTVSPSGGKIEVKPKREADTDATLKSLSVGEGAISPAFSSSVTSYSMSVGAGVNSLTISANPNSKYADVSISGNSLKAGENTVNITVTAENGTKKVYSIKVTKAQATPSPTPLPTSTPTPTPSPTKGAEITVNKLSVNENGDVEINQSNLVICDKITVTAPAGFDKSTTKIKGFDIEILKLNDGNTVLVQLSDERLYVYDKETDTFSLYQTLATLERYYTIVMAPETEVPAGYALTAVKIGSETYPAYRLTADDEFLLMFAENGQWYKYDTIEHTIQRKDESEDKVVVITPTPMPTETPATGGSNVPTEGSSQNQVATDASSTGVKSSRESIIKVVLMTVVFLLAIIFMILYVRERNRNLGFIADEKEELADKDVTEDQSGVQSDGEITEENDDTEDKAEDSDKAQDDEMTDEGISDEAFEAALNEAVGSSDETSGVMDDIDRFSKYAEDMTDDSE